MTRTKALRLHFDHLKEKVIDEDICVRCGACVGVCPVTCLDMQGGEEGWPRLIPEIPCVSCGLCSMVCPVIDVPFDELNTELFGRARAETDEFGVFQEAYIGKAAATDLAAVGAAGGVSSALLAYVIDHDIVDGALVGGMNADEPWKTEARIVRTREEVYTSAGSHYTTIPINALWGEVKKRRERVAIIGSGCHISGVRKLQEFAPNWKRQIPVTIGLLCGSNWNPSVTEQLLRDMGVDDPSQVTRFRSRGALGLGATATLESGEERLVGRSFGLNVWRVDPVWGCEGCVTCLDYDAELADISVADHLAGVSQIYARTDMGVAVVRGAIEHGYLDVTRFDPLTDTQRTPTHRFIRDLKIKRSTTVIQDRLARGRPAPSYSGRELRSVDHLWKNQFNRRLFLTIRRFILKVQPFYRRLFSHVPYRVQYTIGTMFMGREIGRRWELANIKGFYRRHVDPDAVAHELGITKLPEVH